MIHDGGAPAPGPADPTWYLVLDVLGTWIGALGSAAAAIAAVWLGLNAVRGQRAQALQQARAQAELVTLVRRWQPGGVYLQIRNDSTRAITGVRVVTEGGRRDEIDVGSERDVIEPESSVEIHFAGAEDRHSLAAVEFDDAANQSWVRLTDGRLILVMRRRSEFCLVVSYRKDVPDIVSGIGYRGHPDAPPHPLSGRTMRGPRRSSSARGREVRAMMLKRRIRRLQGPE